jgi:rRNA maturation endonuclease Nob1
MSLTCKGVCFNPEYAYKKTIRNITKTPYKKCSKCCLFIKYEGVFCPCCGVKLSNRAANNKSRKKRVDIINSKL